MFHSLLDSVVLVGVRLNLVGQNTALSPQYLAENPLPDTRYGRPGR